MRHHRAQVQRGSHAEPGRPLARTLISGGDSRALRLEPPQRLTRSRDVVRIRGQVVTELTITCTACGREQRTKPTAKAELRLPRAWKRHRGVWCASCWSERWVLRAITIPVAGPVDGTWDDLREDLAQCWSCATSVANWAVAELLKADVVRTPEMEKLPAMPRTYLYPGAREVAPDMDTGSVVSLLQQVERRYRARRYQVVWQRRAAPPSYRYPMPYPIHNQRWRARRGPNGEALIEVPLAGRRWTLRLRGGAGFRRQLKAVHALIDEAAVQGELALYQRRGSRGDHRPTADVKQPKQLMAKLVMWLPKRERSKEQSGTLVVRTDPNSLLVYHMDGEEPRYIHADQARRWVAEHRRKLQRTADDTKREKRVPKRQRHQITQKRATWAAKHRRRMDSLTHEVSAMIAGYAERRRAAAVVLDDDDRDYVESFPWHELRTKLAYKLEERGIEFRTAAAVSPSSSGRSTPLSG